ncbi:basic amino acid ABC transporter substrate-binding protein [Selenihalanaerobacter shriftii]|uniref:Amino acid ABC transporter substrate-binding protein, PAAT family n=1 Tax=Selenihalanaerobacter shriftii TaxID=142842 RepID=A0A1T4KLH8_9FIRM|nr:basic amino acid ABC transporter substrate-binding protein [Selenihalanaerobacter shriftii]SJZ43251.1 amino acid ABC transporter substrate-binding protein, PAAT family [Selenihalanaerobacter shriftii]
MKKGLKLFLVALLALTLVMGVVGCSGGDKQQTKTTFDQIKEKGKIMVGTSADYKPFEYVNEDGEIVGFDVELMKAVGQELDLEVEFVDTSFDGLIPSLKSKKYDAIVSAMTITEKRKKAVDFSQPYFNAGQVIAVMEGTEDVKGPKDLKGKVVGVQLGSTGDLKASEMENIKQVKRYEKMIQAYIELKNGRVDAVVNDLPVTAAYIMKNPNVKIVGEPFTAENYGIAIREDDDALEKAINNAIAKLKENGTYDEIYNKWFK